MCSRRASIFLHLFSFEKKARMLQGKLSSQLVRKNSNFQLSREKRRASIGLRASEGCRDRRCSTHNGRPRLAHAAEARHHGHGHDRRSRMEGSSRVGGKMEGAAGVREKGAEGQGQVGSFRHLGCPSGRLGGHEERGTSTGERTRNLHIPWPLANVPSSILGSSSSTTGNTRRRETASTPT